MTVIKRKDWGAGPHQSPRISTPVPKLVLHHAVTPEWTGVKAARNLDHIARGRGFAEISYSWLVDVAGNEIEGRGWGYQGAHTKGYNSSAHAICLIGNFENKVPPRAMLLGVARVIRRGRPFGPNHITHGHRQLAPPGYTQCPGNRALRLIPEMNKLAKQNVSDLQEDFMFCERGDSGENVILLQVRLRNLDYYTGEIDGDYGPKTSAAVLKMRKDQGSSADSGDKFNEWAIVQLERATIQHYAGELDEE